MKVTYKHTVPRFRIKSIRFGEPGFIMNDENGFSIIPRGSLEISKECPENHRKILLECINKCWLIPVVHMKESEWIWEKLGE